MKRSGKHSRITECNIQKAKAEEHTSLNITKNNDNTEISNCLSIEIAYFFKIVSLLLSLLDCPLLHHDGRWSSWPPYSVLWWWSKFFLFLPIHAVNYLFKIVSLSLLLSSLDSPLLPHDGRWSFGPPCCKFRGYFLTGKMTNSQHFGVIFLLYIIPVDIEELFNGWKNYAHS